MRFRKLENEIEFGSIGLSISPNIKFCSILSLNDIESSSSFRRSSIMSVNFFHSTLWISKHHIIIALRYPPYNFFNHLNYWLLTIDLLLVLKQYLKLLISRCYKFSYFCNYLKTLLIQFVQSFPSWPITSFFINHIFIKLVLRSRLNPMLYSRCMNSWVFNISVAELLFFFGSYDFSILRNQSVSINLEYKLSHYNTWLVTIKIESKSKSKSKSD